MKLVVQGQWLIQPVLQLLLGYLAESLLVKVLEELVDLMALELCVEIRYHRVELHDVH